MAAAYVPGLQGIVAARTRLSRVDGQMGELVIGGFAVEEIAGRASFEELVFLLWNDRLPNARELAALRAELASLRELPPIARDILEAPAAQNVPPMDALRMAAGTLSLRTDVETTPAGPYRDAPVAVARLPTIFASYVQLAPGGATVAPHHPLRSTA